MLQNWKLDYKGYLHVWINYSHQFKPFAVCHMEAKILSSSGKNLYMYVCTILWGGWAASLIHPLYLVSKPGIYWIPVAPTQETGWFRYLSTVYLLAFPVCITWNPSHLTLLLVSAPAPRLLYSPK